MKNFFRYAVFAVFCVFLLLISSCKNDSDEENNSSASSFESVAYKGGIITFYTPNGLGDNSYVDSFCLGVQKTALKNNLLAYDVCPSDWTDAKKLIDDYLPRCYELTKEQKKPVLIFFADTGYTQYLSAHTATKPESVSFLIFDSKESQNTALNTVYIPLYGASYLAGVASKALLSEKTKTRVLSLIANDSTPAVKDSLKGFIAGYGVNWNETVYDYKFLEWSEEKGQEFTAQDFAVLALKNETDTSGFASAELAYALALFAQKLNPFDLYFPVCGGSVQGLLRYNREKGTNSFYTVGMDSDLSVYTSQVPFSVVKHVDLVIQKCVEQWMKGSIPHHQNFTLEGEYTGLVISESYKKQLSADVQKNVQEALEEATKKAIAGEKEYEGIE